MPGNDLHISRSLITQTVGQTRNGMQCFLVTKLSVEVLSNGYEQSCLPFPSLICAISIPFIEGFLGISSEFLRTQENRNVDSHFSFLY